MKIIFRKKIHIFSYIILTILVFQGCAGRPIRQETTIEKNSILYKEQIESNKNLIKKNIANLFYIGLALWGDKGNWSENDIIDIKILMHKIYKEKIIIPFIISNKNIPSPQIYPTFDKKNFKNILTFINEHYTEEDLIVIVISSHGNQAQISNKTSTGPDIPITAQDMRKIFSPISFKKYLFIISACYSGSLINSLSNEKSVIITAASAQKPSFGCEDSSSNTWFVDSLKKGFIEMQFYNIKFSLKKWFIISKRIITLKEKLYGYLPSNPQLFIGKKVHSTDFML